MFSDVLKSALDEQVVGQPGAVNSVVRGVTRAVSDIVPREGTRCAYLFMGPSGTGKTHLVRTLARILHGDEGRMVVADCTHFAQGDPWMAFVHQLAPLFANAAPRDKWSVIETPPLSVVLLEYLERGRKEVSKALAAALETGQLMLPEGRRGSLRNCLVFITSSLCTREILAEPQIGFTPSAEDAVVDEDRDRMLKTCLGTAEEHFGSDLVGRLDGLIIFHRLQEEHLAAILDRRLGELNRYLELRRFRCRLEPTARAFLLERGRRDLRLGARDLVRAFRRFVEFPVADLTISGRLSGRGEVRVECRSGADHLHFTVRETDGDEAACAAFRSVPVTGGEPPAFA